MVFLWVIGAIVLAALLMFSAYAATVGGLGVVSSSRYERCPICGHHGLVHQGRLHPAACPPSHSLRLAHLVHTDHRGAHPLRL